MVYEVMKHGGREGWRGGVEGSGVWGFSEQCTSKDTVVKTFFSPYDKDIKDDTESLSHSINH